MFSGLFQNKSFGMFQPTHLLWFYQNWKTISPCIVAIHVPLRWQTFSMISSTMQSANPRNHFGLLFSILHPKFYWLFSKYHGSCIYVARCLKNAQRHLDDQCVLIRVFSKSIHRLLQYFSVSPCHLLHGTLYCWYSTRMQGSTKSRLVYQYICEHVLVRNTCIWWIYLCKSNFEKLKYFQLSDKIYGI